MANEIMTPREAAALFKVNPKTLTRWADEGKVPCFKTLGGHRRFYRADIEALRNKNSSSGD